MRLIWGCYDPKEDLFAKIELVSLLASEDAEARAEAMRRLEIAGEDELLPFLMNCLTLNHGRLRSAAARVLAWMRDDSVLLHLIDALADTNVRTNTYSVGAADKVIANSLASSMNLGSRPAAPSANLSTIRCGGTLSTSRYSSHRPQISVEMSPCFAA